MKAIISRVSVLFAVMGVVLVGCHSDEGDEQYDAFHYGPGPGGEAPPQLEDVE